MRSAWLSVCVLSLVVACKPSEDDTSGDTDTSETGDTDDTNVVDEPCTATIDRIIPLDGSLGVGVEEEISVMFSAPVRAGDVVVSLSDGETTALDVNVQVAGDGLSAVITHDALAESTQYTVSIAACEQSGSSVFTTTAGPVDESIEDEVYALDYDDVEWVDPAWAGAFSNLLPLEYVLVEILDINTALQELDAVGAIGFWDENTEQIYQGACYDPMIYTDVDFSDNPSFQVGPSDLFIPNGNLTIYNLRIQAAFADAGGSLVGIDITGQVDARQIQENMPSVDACAWAEQAEDACIPCDSDGTLNCLNLWLSADEAPLAEVLGTDFEPGIDQSYVAAEDGRCD
jgi:hypothetical protein